MDRRQFLRNATLIASGAIAADQLELLDRLGWVRRFFSGCSFGSSESAIVVAGDFDALYRNVFIAETLFPLTTPFVSRLRKPRSLIVPTQPTRVYRVRG